MQEDTCLLYLKEAQAFLEKVTEVDTYSTIFEAESEEVKQKIAENENSKGKSSGALAKAAHALVEFIRNACKTIVGFFEKLFASKEDKSEFERYKEILQRHPEYKDKKIKFYDYKHHQDELDKLAEEVERIDRKLASGIDVDIDEIIEKLSGIGKNAGEFVTTEFTAQAALNACYGSKEVAKLLTQAMERDATIIHKLEESLGAKTARSIKKEIKSLSKDHFSFFGKRINLRRALNKARVRECNSLMSSLNYTKKQFSEVFRKVGDAVAVTADNDYLIRKGGPINKLKAKMNTGKMYAKLGKLYATDKTARQIGKSMRHQYKNNPEIRDAVNKTIGVAKSANKMKKDYWDDRRKKTKERDQALVDYNLRTNSGDYSAQSAFSFLTGADKRRVEEEKRRRNLEQELES